jgi:hypothetical protein
LKARARLGDSSKHTSVHAPGMGAPSC